MNPWPFVIAAYALTLVGTFLLVASSWAAMRRAEAEANKLKSSPGFPEADQAGRRS